MEKITETVAARERNAMTPVPRTPGEGDFCVCGATFLSTVRGRACGSCGRSPRQSEEVRRRMVREWERQQRANPKMVDVRSETVIGVAYHGNYVGDPNY